MKQFGFFLTVAFFLLFTVGGGLALLLRTPPEEIAEERRPAAKPPTLSYAALTDGSLTEGLEAHLTDRLPLRQKLYALHTALVTKLFVSSSCHGIRQTKTGLEKTPEVIDGAVSHNLDKLEACLSLMGETSQNAQIALIPHKGHFDAPTVYDSVWQEVLSREFLPIDITDTLSKADYFLGDIHIRPEAAADLCECLADALSVRVTDRLAPCRSYEGMGTLARQFPTDLTDRFTCLYDDNGVVAACRVNRGGNRSLLYRETAMQSGDPYDLYLGSEQDSGIVVVESPMAESDRRLVLFRDSFARALLPYFVGSYREIVLIDIRTPFRLIKEDLSLFADDKTDILILVSMHSLPTGKY